MGSFDCGKIRIKMPRKPIDIMAYGCYNRGIITKAKGAEMRINIKDNSRGAVSVPVWSRTAEALCKKLAAECVALTNEMVRSMR